LHAGDGLDGLARLVKSTHVLLFLLRPGREGLGIPLPGLGDDSLPLRRRVVTPRRNVTAFGAGIAFGFGGSAPSGSTETPSEAIMRRRPLKNPLSSSGSDKVMAQTSFAFLPSSS
jgi:hypothetical protein